jgi:GTPase SAR1 family protein
MSKNIILYNKHLHIQVWDTVSKKILFQAGQETFKSITRSYYKNSACVFLIYDITNRESFQNIQTWMEECVNSCPKSSLLILIGNKKDLDSK